MRRAIYPIFIILLLLCINIGCKKDRMENQVVGTWEFRGVVGGLAVVDQVNNAPGNGNLLKFKKDTYQAYSDGKIRKSGSYIFARDSRQINDKKANAYLYFDQDKEKIYLKLSGKKLILFYGIIAADGVEITYERLGM